MSLDGPLQIFVATTREAIEEDWLRDALGVASEAVQKRYRDVELQPWTSAFISGDITAPRLVEVAATTLGAVVVLTSEDWVASRENSELAPRDNLIFESGAFMAQLGLRHVLLLRERDSKWPSDLLGVTPVEFSRPPGDQEGTSKIIADNIALRIEQFVRRLVPAGASGAARAVGHSSIRVTQQARQFRAALDLRGSDQPLIIPDPTAAYLEAVNRVEKTFATTTYLESEFWTSTDLNVVAANRELLKRVQDADGTARRLILLSRPIEDELEAQRRVRGLLRSGDPERIEQMNREYERFATSTRGLIDQGFEVKVVYDRSQQHRHLPSAIGFEEGDTELALYDTSRVDSFSGFTSKERSYVEAFLAGRFDQFDTLQEQVQHYFEHLWTLRDAQDFIIFGENMDMLIDDVAREVDYEKNWLIKYDKVVGADGVLKEAESAFVLACLRARYGTSNGCVASHIDIGTCTGRYIGLLDPLVRAGGITAAVDNDRDCTELLKLKQDKMELPESADVIHGDIRRRDDLPPEKFAVVTCMMGTLCHLRRLPASAQGFDDDWQTGLDNLAWLMADDGDVFIAIWNKAVCDRNHGANQLLNIYQDKSSTLLCEQTPSIDEMKMRLRQAGLRIAKTELVKRRLRVYHLRKLGRDEGISS